MSTTEIIWIVVIVVVALALIGLIVMSMRKKSAAANREKAAHLRERADTQAADLPDAQARADQAATQAERARLEAQRAEEQAAAVRAEADQRRAIHEDQIRAADRLDPDVDHKAKDYSPQVVDPAGPSNVPADPAYADPDTGRASTAATGSTSARTTGGGSSATLEPTDTSPRDETAVNDTGSMRDRLDGDTSERSETSDRSDTSETSDRTDGTDRSGGAHRS